MQEHAVVNFVKNIGRFGTAWHGYLFCPTAICAKIIAGEISEAMECAVTRRGADTDLTFPGGEVLRVRTLQRPEDVWRYHGVSAPFVGFIEAYGYPTQEMWGQIRPLVRNLPEGVSHPLGPYGS